jgi:enamine deaminase RidA (YjgF/YER057c/UK114 family)
MLNRLIAAGSLIALLAAPLAAQSGTSSQAAGAAPPSEVTYYGNPRSAISSGVIVPPDRAWLWVSGVGPSRANASAPAGSRDAYGDTRTQAASVLKNIASQLTDHGLSMKDVIYLRAYLVPDPMKDHKIDMQGWSAAYGEVFGTAENPTKPARATLGVAALVNADQLIEIEVVAVYPK